MAFPHATPDLESMLVFDAGSVTQRSIQCRVMQCSPWDETLTKILSCPAIHVLAYWGNKKTNTLLATHVSASGACPAVRLLPLHGNDSASAVFTNEHKQCSRSGKAIVVRIGGTRELLLTATFSSDEQGRRTPVFWGYVLLHHLATAVADMMQMGRLALVFDLDETLLVANSSSTLENKAGACRRARHGIAKELEALGEAASEAERARLQLHDLACQKEEELLQLDQELLKQFADNDYVRISGQPVRARYESVTLEDGTLVNRPVIRVEVAGVQVILTRIDPKVRETSMILRLRPGWEDLRAFLAGENDVPGPDGKPKQRFQVFVCTAAERQYALEAWRLLDVSSSLIPLEQRSKRIVNVSGAKKKSVLETLGVLKQRLAKRNGAQQSQADDLEEADMRGVMPLALVIDDRVEVWEASSQPHILQVVPWAYYRDEARRLAGVPSHMAAISEVELRRVWASAMRLRSETFHSINVVVKAQLDCFMRAGAPEAMQTPQLMQQLLPRVQTVPVLLRDLRCEALYAMPSVATASIAAAAVAVVLEPPGAPAASTPAAAINSLSGLPKGDVQLGPPPSRPPAPSPERLAPAAVARLAEVAEQLLTGRPPRRAAALLPSPTPLKQPLAADMKAASATALPGERLAPARQLPTPAAARADAVAPGPSHQGPTSKPLAADAGAESAAPLSEAHKTPGDDQTKMRRLTQLRFGVKPARLRQQVPVAGSQAEVAGQAADLPAQPPQEQQPLTVCNELQQHWQQQGLQQQQQQPQREHGGRPHDVPAQQQQQSQQQQQQQQQLQQQQQQQSRQQQGRQPHDVPMQQQQAGGQPQGMPTQKLQQQVQPEVVSAEQQQQQQPLVQMQPQRQPDARPHCRPSAMNGQQQSQLLQEHLKNNMVMIRPSKRVTEAEQGHALWGTGPPQAQEVVVVTDEMDADDSGQVFQQQDPELSQCKKRPQGKSSQKRRDKRRKLQQLLLLQRSQTGSESKDGSVGVHPAAATARREGLLQRHGAEEVPSSSNNPVDAGDYDEDAAMAGADANTNNIPADTGVNVEVAGQAATQRWKEANKCWREAKKEWTKLRSSGQLEPGVNVDAADKWSKAKKDWTKAKKEWTKLHRANIGMSVTSGGNGAGNSVTRRRPFSCSSYSGTLEAKGAPKR